MGNEEPRPQEGAVMPMNSVQAELDRLIIENKVTNEKVFDWIDVSIIYLKQKSPVYNIITCNT